MPTSLEQKKKGFVLVHISLKACTESNLDWEREREREREREAMYKLARDKPDIEPHMAD